MVSERKKIPVAVLGATGSVGQKFVELLIDHPWFEIQSLAASERSAGKSYSTACQWRMGKPLPKDLAEKVVERSVPPLNSKIVFSGLDASVAGEIEQEFARKGSVVISNARNHRMDQDVPLVVPGVNSDHLQLLDQQIVEGAMITNPNCSTAGLVIALKPLEEAFGLESVSVVTLQAVSGAGYPGVASLDVVDNVIPYIPGEEQKIESETLKILGDYVDGKIRNKVIKLSAHCNRVPVVDGHLECVSVKLKRSATKKEVVDVFRKFSSQYLGSSLPTAPKELIRYFEEESFPQPRLHRDLEGGMGISIGRLREDSIFDFRFTLLVHNTVQGAAGCALLNAETYIERLYDQLQKGGKEEQRGSFYKSQTPLIFS